MTPLLIQIQRWMMHTKVWTFIGIASAIVGLLCYALSSSFNHLFGNWNLVKIFLYTIFSFIICLIVLFARTWRDSRSLRFKAHSAFLVLVITSIYSFFSDKVMNGKPDAYSSISYASFALMSLSLSRQIQCGFEVDLMYFYLGCLIVQLMKFNLLLAIVGVCYSYCLVILRSSFTSLSATSENQSLELEEQRIVIRVDSQQHENINCGSNSNIMQQFMTCMDEVKQNNSNIAKMLLEKVKGNYKLVATDHNFIIDAIEIETINHLRESVKTMVDAGFEKVCSDLYINMRKEWLESLLINKLLGLGKMGFQDYMIGRWIKVFKVALRILFPSERRLYDLVFSESTSIPSDIYFTKVCHGATIELLNFADLFANRIASAWRLFKILDLFETLSDLIPEFESLFTDSLVNEAIKLRNKLGEVSRDIFMEFGNLIFLTPVGELDCWVDGGVHPMTCEATGYILMAFWSRKNLEQVLREYSVVVADGTRTSLFYTRMERIMEQFERNLEAKSQIYEDHALRYFFMMNNISQVEYLLETFWDDRFCKNTRQYLELYCKSSWNKVIDFLKMDINESLAPNSKADLTKEKLNLFNQKLKEMCGIQSKWRVFNKQLKKQIIVYVENMLLPAYENFIEEFENVVGENADEYTMYGVSDIQDELNNLFLLQDVESVRGPVSNQIVSQ
ncbi:exocyst complex component EXO70B1-like [Vicia villosa]|uniref:exocyst complex component EXO70B1-like n=1 Tax=Vicia villosa TaxID=3911 RepID=UPI00273C5BD0|nr:exocyst complex component EXO70B1-like [Vicia villosa]